MSKLKKAFDMIKGGLRGMSNSEIAKLNLLVANELIERDKMMREE